MDLYGGAVGYVVAGKAVVSPRSLMLACILSHSPPPRPKAVFIINIIII